MDRYDARFVFGLFVGLSVLIGTTGYFANEDTRLKLHAKVECCRLGKCEPDRRSRDAE